jgi:hypothetical protein
LVVVQCLSCSAELTLPAANCAQLHRTAPNCTKNF